MPRRCAEAAIAMAEDQQKRHIKRRRAPSRNPKRKKTDGRVRGPHSWDRAVQAALLYITRTPETKLEDIAKSVGVGETTFRNWRNDTWWPDAIREADDRYISGLSAAARTALMTHVITDPATCRMVAERTIPALAPPQHRQEPTDDSDRAIELGATDMGDDADTGQG